MDSSLTIRKRSFSDTSDIPNGGGLRFVSCTFHRTDLTRLSLVQSVFENCSFVDVKFPASTVHGRRYGLSLSSFIKCDISSCHFISSSLLNMQFSSCVIRDCIITQTSLNGSVFSDTTIQDCEFDSVRLTRTTGLKILHSSLVKVNFTGASLCATSFDNMKISDCIFIKSRYDDVSFFGTRFDGCNFKGAKFHRCNFTEAVFSKCDLTYTKVSTDSRTDRIRLIESSYNEQTQINGVNLDDQIMIIGERYINVR